MTFFSKKDLSETDLTKREREGENEEVKKKSFLLRRTSKRRRKKTSYFSAPLSKQPSTLSLSCFAFFEISSFIFLSQNQTTEKNTASKKLLFFSLKKNFKTFHKKLHFFRATRPTTRGSAPPSASPPRAWRPTRTAAC